MPTSTQNQFLLLRRDLLRTAHTQNLVLDVVEEAHAQQQLVVEPVKVTPETWVINRLLFYSPKLNTSNKVEDLAHLDASDLNFFLCGSKEDVDLEV